MKFFHLADLHLGKSIHGFSLIEEGDQPYWADHFLKAVDEQRPDGVVIAGDIYDRAVPPKEAVELFDQMLTALARRGIPVLIVAGNHDSGPRLAFASGLLEREGVYIAGEAKAEMVHVTLQDEFGPVTFWLMPFLFPAAVRYALDQEDLGSYDEAVRVLLAEQRIDFSQRNVLVAHQFVVSGGEKPEMGGSETTVGGLGQVDASAFDGFDYVALGHIHGAQKIGREEVRYGGSPLPYSFSEVNQRKGLTLVEMGEKGQLSVRLLELPPLHKMRQEKGTLEEILNREGDEISQEDYLRVVLTDPQMPARAMEQLRAVYPNLMEVVREGTRPEGEPIYSKVGAVKEKPLEELFWNFFAHQTGEVPDQFQLSLVEFTSEQVRRGGAPGRQKREEPDSDTLALVEFALRHTGGEELSCGPTN